MAYIKITTHNNVLTQHTQCWLIQKPFVFMNNIISTFLSLEKRKKHNLEHKNINIIKSFHNKIIKGRECVLCM